MSIIWSRMNLKEVVPELPSTLFPIAKAVVTEMGDILSHVAIVAREYGTPCVVNAGGSSMSCRMVI